MKRAATRRQPRFTASTFSIGLALVHLESLFRPVQPAIHQIYEEDVEEDADDAAAHLHRQLHRIRRGEPLDQLTVRLSVRTR